jgi:hypothetical protein
MRMLPDDEKAKIEKAALKAIDYRSSRDGYAIVQYRDDYTKPSRPKRLSRC